MEWTTYHPRRALWIGLGLIAVLLALLIPLTPRELLFTGREIAGLAGWSLIVATWAIGRRVERLQDMHRSQSACPRRSSTARSTSTCASSM